jgi:membrane protease subunit HflK
VQAEQTAVVQRLGRIARIAGPGLHFKLPCGLERVRLVPTARVLKEEFGFRTAIPGQRTRYERRDFDQESLMLTGDLNVIDVEWIVQYRIEDPAAYLFRVREPRETMPRPSRGGWSAIVWRVTCSRSVDWPSLARSRMLCKGS